MFMSLTLSVFSVGLQLIILQSVVWNSIKSKQNCEGRAHKDHKTLKVVQIPKEYLIRYPSREWKHSVV